MPINKKWSTYSKDNVKANATDNLGAYEIGNSLEVLYIGEGQVKTRLLHHFPNAREPVVGGSGYRVQYTGTKAKAVKLQNELLAEFKKKHGRLPRFNERSKN